VNEDFVSTVKVAMTGSITNPCLLALPAGSETIPTDNPFAVGPGTCLRV